MNRHDAAGSASPHRVGRDATGGTPRQEYVDAFSDEQYGQPLPVPGPRRGEPGEGAPPGASTGADTEEPAGRDGVPGTEPEPGAETGAETGAEAGHRTPAPRPGRRRHRADRRRAARRGGWGRTVTGAAAAAVAAVLTVVVAGEMHGGVSPANGDAADRRPHLGQQDLPPGDAGEARSVPEGEAEQAPEPDPEPTYDELMETRFPLDPDLTGDGELVPVGGSDPAADPDALTVLRYRVDVEADIGLDPELFAQAVHRTLNDQRGWGNNGERSFARVSSGDYDFVITLASPGTTAEWCDKSGLDIRQTNVSCDSASTERVMLNAWRWAQGAETYGDDMHAYRQMLINHEVGHRIGYGHVGCSAEGALAPVMMQQTKFLTWTNGLTCRPNPWPHPEN
ncbi:DUF3152 domain-containing protein [Streptomyces xiamenensis]